MPSSLPALSLHSAPILSSLPILLHVLLLCENANAHDVPIFCLMGAISGLMRALCVDVDGDGRM